jgi:hypothetical protein
MLVRTFLGGCCGIAEVKGLGRDYLSKLSTLETETERTIRVLKAIFNFKDTGTNLNGSSGSGREEKLQAYVFADRANSNGKQIADHIKTLNIGEVYESEKLTNTYSSHGGLNNKTGFVQLYVFYPNWDNFTKWTESLEPKKEEGLPNIIKKILKK